MKNYIALFTLLAVLIIALGCKSLSDSYPTEIEVETTSLHLINSQRAEVPTSAVALDDQLAQLARGHSTDMQVRGYVSEITPEGQTLADRLKAAHIHFIAAGETVTRTTNVADPATFAWGTFMNTPGDRVVIQDGRFTKVGIGVVRAGDSYWITEDFIQQ